MIKSICAAALAMGLIASGVGCKHNENDASPDRHPRPEGRLEVDQSAVLPVNVKAGVQHEYPGSAVQSVSKRTYDDHLVRYEVTVQTRDGKQVTRVFDAEGKPSSAK